MTSETYEQWAARGLELMRQHNRTCWMLGDWINEGEKAWGEKYAQAHEDTLISYGTLANYAWVTREYPPDTDARQFENDLSFSHHKVALGLPDLPARMNALRHAYEMGMSRDDFADYIAELKNGGVKVTPVVRTWPGRVSAVDTERGLVIVQLDGRVALEVGAAVTVMIV